jgi:hypothetical protein
MTDDHRKWVKETSDDDGVVDSRWRLASHEGMRGVVDGL